jgi:hypothetical protein
VCKYLGWVVGLWFRVEEDFDIGYHLGFDFGSAVIAGTDLRIVHPIK